MNSFSLASASVQFLLMFFFLPLVSLHWPVGAWSGEPFLFFSQGSSGEKKKIKPKSYFAAIPHLPLNSWFCAFCDWLPCVAPGELKSPTSIPSWHMASCWLPHLEIMLIWLITALGQWMRSCLTAFLMTPLKIDSWRGKCCLSAFGGPSKLICRVMQRMMAINPLLSLQAFH